jgi:hypothetical protein
MLFFHSPREDRVPLPSPKAIIGQLVSVTGYEVRRRTDPWDRLLGLAERR